MWIGGFLLNVSKNHHNYTNQKTTSDCVHWIYLIHEFHNLSWITEINELFHDILIYWDAPVNICDPLCENPAKVIFLWFAVFYIKSSFIW